MARKGHAGRAVVHDQGYDETARRTQLRSAKNSRYALVRYGVAVLFFLDFYWVLLLGFTGHLGIAAVLPTVGMTICGICMWEHYAVLVSAREDLPLTRDLMVGSSFLSGVTLVVTLSAGTSLLFPFFSSVGPACAALAVALVVKAAIIFKIGRIHDHLDRGFDRYQALLNNDRMVR
ncbi:MAG: hypothetical protein PHR15_07580 [Atopobiaceae bacterium]|jgi:hypothetical protein|nr:hypothetical protein [Atopobiaceae bacterium]MCH4180987.1 hypothetical protein [Atopobiaceae bacterium]MCH4214422.1 hypothetical protein [Atopobiaceae bacterium]MCH4229352.1 hypothetical protein [Atopobiaceae bacterium]MCH4276690.1 hypothetical protein [Atopobiaceae bacterium]